MVRVQAICNGMETNVNPWASNSNMHIRVAPIEKPILVKSAGPVNYKVLQLMSKPMFMVKDSPKGIKTYKNHGQVLLYVNQGHHYVKSVYFHISESMYDKA